MAFSSTGRGKILSRACPWRLFYDRQEGKCVSDAGLAVDQNLVHFLPEDREHRYMVFPCQVGGKLDLEAGASYPARPVSAVSSGDPVYLSGERPLELNSGAAEDGRSRVLEA